MATNQKTFIKQLHEFLTLHEIEHEFYGKNKDVTLASMKINDVMFNDMSAWTCDDFTCLMSFITECLNIGMNREELKKELYMYSNVSLNIDACMDFVEYLNNIINKELKTGNIRRLTRNVKLLRDSKLIEFIRNNKINLIKLEDNFNINELKQIAENVHEIYMRAYACVQKADACCIIEKRIAEIQQYMHVCGLNSKEYVKDSYKNSKDNLLHLLAIAMNDCKLAQNKFDDTYNTRINHDFSSVESAFLYKGYYITPYILQAVIEQTWKSCTKAQQNAYLQKYYAEKVNIKTIANDMLSDMFNNNNVERLTYMDDLRFNNIEV